MLPVREEPSSCITTTDFNVQSWTWKLRYTLFRGHNRHLELLRLKLHGISKSICDMHCLKIMLMNSTAGFIADLYSLICTTLFETFSRIAATIQSQVRQFFLTKYTANLRESTGAAIEVVTSIDMSPVKYMGRNFRLCPIQPQVRP